ncbi:MAG: pyrroline-5-carboxylate reductase [Clostridium sp.]
MMCDKKVGFIGFGNAGQAMAKGMIYKEAVLPEQILACARDWDKLCAVTDQMGVQPYKTSQEVVENADIIILAVKPDIIENVLVPIREILRKKIVVSVAVGYSFKMFENILLPGTHHLSIMPNTPVEVGEGIIICEGRHSLTDAEFSEVDELFSQIALVEVVDSKLLSISGAICGCGPAFVSVFIEALSDAAVKHGLPRSLSYRLASQLLAGTGKLQLETGVHPGVMKDAVCSPGGTTIIGIATLERKGFRSAVIDAVDSIEKEY